MVKVGVQDRFYDVNVRSSILASDKVIDELQVHAMNNLISFVIESFSSIRLCKGFVNIAFLNETWQESYLGLNLSAYSGSGLGSIFGPGGTQW
jgi:hypothetical protein